MAVSSSLQQNIIILGVLLSSSDRLLVSSSLHIDVGTRCSKCLSDEVIVPLGTVTSIVTLKQILSKVCFVAVTVRVSTCM